MKGLEIFLHSVRQVLGNLPGAVKVSAVPYAVQALAAMLLLGPGMASGQMDMSAMMSGQGGPSIVLVLLNLLISIVASVWIAVAWHRFILSNEAPTGFLPAFHSDRMLAYFLRALGIGIICILLGIVLGIVAGFVAFPFMSMSGPGIIGLLIIMLVTYFPLALISYRLATSLPSVALDRGGSFMEGWEATKGENGAIIVLALITVLIMFASAVIGIYAFGGSRTLFIVWTLAFNWVAMMVGVSVLTTLYGHYIEKRELV